MTVHCPHCGKEFEKGQFPLGDEVTCIHCEKSFSLSRKETIPVGGGDDGGAGEAVRNTQVTPLPGRAEVGGQLAGYTLERELGRGGMGVVYLATQESLGRKVAVKVLPRKLSEDDSFVRRFEREAQSLAKLNHASIVSILDKGLVGGTYYFVMEFVDGVSLRNILEEKRLTPAEALRIVRQICDALEYAHGEGVVHRDIKPENILIDRKGNAKIADFGLARLVTGDTPRSRITRSQIIMGSPDYMAPEQRENAKDVDHRADLYSLGVVFYEMLTGELPLGNFPPPSQKNLGLDVNIDRIVLKVLEKDPEMRYSRASDVATEIEGLKKGNGLLASAGAGLVAGATAARAKGLLKEAGSFIREHPWILIPLAPFIVALFAVGAPFLPALAALAIPLAAIGWLWHASYLEAKVKEARIRAGRAEGNPRAPGVPSRLADHHGGGPSPQEPAPPQPPGYSILGPIVFILAALLLLSMIALTGPLAELTAGEFYSLTREEMVAILATSILFAVPALLVLVCSFWARARARRRRQRGRFFATLAILMSIYSLVWFGGTWSDYQDGYDAWREMEDRVAAGDAKAMGEYETLLGDPDLAIRRRAVWSILRAEGDGVVPLLARLLDDPEGRIRRQAARSLRGCGDAATPYLISGLESPDARVRIECAGGLQERVPFELDFKALRAGADGADEVRRIQIWWAKQPGATPLPAETPGDF